MFIFKKSNKTMKITNFSIY